LVIELKEHEHKRSLKRIFAAHPEVNEEIVKSANDEVEEIPAPPAAEDTPPPPPLSEDTPPPPADNPEPGLPTKNSATLLNNPKTYVTASLLICSVILSNTFYYM